MTSEETLMRPNGAPSNEVCTEAGRGRKDLATSDDKQAPAPRPIVRRMSPRKWNRLGRSHSQPPTANRALQPMSPVAVAVKFAADLPGKKKPVAFYTVFDSSDQDDEDVNAGDLLREACVLGSQRASSFNNSKKRPSLERSMLDSDTSLTRRRQQRYLFKRQPEVVEQPSLPQKQRKLQLFQTANKPPGQKVPVQPLARATFPTASLLSQTSTDVPNKSSSKLPQVECVHETVSGGSLGRTSPKSFSRPFRRVSVQLPSSLAPLIKPLSKDSDTDEPFFPITLIPDFVLDEPAASGRTADAVQYNFCQSQTLQPEAYYGDVGSKAFIDPLEILCDMSSTNSSGLLSFTHAIAVVPDPSAPLVEDEIWDEYNDIFGDFEEQTEAEFSAGSLKKAVLRSEIPLKKENAEPLVAIAYPTSQLKSFTSQFVTSPAKMSSRALSKLPPAPFSDTDSVSGHDDQNHSKATSPSIAKRSIRQSAKGATRRSDSDLCSQDSKDNSILLQVKLRVSSMTVSKWLTFGQVLFSPAHDGIVKAVSAPDGHSVLVVDGLGNDDWSFYAAETYPAAAFFNLSARAPHFVDRHCSASAFPLSLPNHHQIRYTLCADKLPFGPEFFHTVVFRFPAAAPTSHYKNIVDEACRVLKPGGYLELSILDLDLNNMGPRTRRAVSQLKERLHSHTPNLHPGSAADAILHFVGMSGFADIKSCRVGIPVANCSSWSSEDTIKPHFGARPRNDLRSHPRNAASDRSKNPDANESITSTVARVGRWWHSQCYGDAALVPNSRQTSNETGSSGIWMDHALIKECEEWQTSFKFTVCYARVPVDKRASSV
ncbi:hypothetical protein SEPCBS57363_006239 [Sporothrix epigloea]|uniref:Methyltransferase type 11 domain-containing protein n=1 Tax=Sporothrix epigloea TaxID=1892477 RepID=A0ABP0E1Y7_9PEZI